MCCSSRSSSLRVPRPSAFRAPRSLSRYRSSSSPLSLPSYRPAATRATCPRFRSCSEGLPRPSCHTCARICPRSRCSTCCSPASPSPRRTRPSPHTTHTGAPGSRSGCSSRSDLWRVPPRSLQCPACPSMPCPRSCACSCASRRRTAPACFSCRTWHRQGWRCASALARLSAAYPAARCSSGSPSTSCSPSSSRP